MARKSQNEPKKRKTKIDQGPQAQKGSRMRLDTPPREPTDDFIEGSFAHKQPVCYFNFHGPGRPLPVMGRWRLEPSVGPAVATAAPGAGALPKEISMGLWGLAEWMDRWTVFE